MYTPSIHMQISSNGLISFGSIFRSIFPQSFPISSNVIAPYWARINLRNKGIVRYATITRSHPTLSCLLDLTNDLIEELENVEFNATWVLVARWIDVCSVGGSSCFEVSIVNINIMHNRLVIHLVVSVYVNLDSSGFTLGVQIPMYTSNLLYNLNKSIPS